MALSRQKGGSFLLEDTASLSPFTPEDLTDEERSLGEMCRKFTETLYTEHDAAIEAQENNVSATLLKQAGELGLLMAEVPECYGGLGLRKATATVLSENSTRQGSFSVTFMCHTGIGTLPILYFGTEAQKQKYLPKLASGEYIGAYALSEAGSGSDALGAKTKAVLSPDGKHYILNGEKMWITNSAWADVFTVFAKVDGKHFTAFLVDRDTPGFSTAAEEKKMGIKGSSTRALSFSDAKIPVENVLGEVGKGHKIAFNILNIGRWKLGAACLGSMKWILREAIAYAKDRQQFNKPLSDFELIQKKLTDMAIRTYFCESAVYRIAGLYDDAIAQIPETSPDRYREALACIEEYAVEASIAKVYGSEGLWFCADEGVQTLGGYGFSAEYPMERVQRDCRVNRIFEGTNEINRLLIPGTLLKRAMTGDLDLMNGVQTTLSQLKDGFPRSGTGPLAQEIDIANFAKKLVLYASGAAIEKYQGALKDEQLAMEILADLTIETFVMESGIARALKSLAKRGPAESAALLATVKTYVNETYPRLLGLARQLFANLADGADGAWPRYEKALARFSIFPPIATLPLRRIIAKQLLEKMSYSIL